MKAGELVVVVDVVEEAVKFYTEKLAFDIIDLRVDTENQNNLSYVRLHKSKCTIIFRMPNVQEFAEFSFIKRCSSRCVYLQVEMKSGIDKYFAKCQKKDISVIQPLREISSDMRSFIVTDPFGVKLEFIQPSLTQPKINLDVLGVSLQRATLSNRKEAEKAYIEPISMQLKRFNVLRRASKKYAKTKIKELVKAVGGK